jgi:hypothetical protein
MIRPSYLHRASSAAVLMMILATGTSAVALDNSQAAAGLKQALSTGSGAAVRLVGRPGGYFNNAAIKILLPKQMQPVAKGLRAIGMGHQVDKFELSMNQAAEAAAPKALPIFEKAIEHMTLTDAQRIVTRGGTAGTDYFKSKTSGELTEAFTPIVKQAMGRYDVTKQYDALMGKYSSGSPLGGLLGGSEHSLNINHYVVEKALDGLFFMVGQEERKIRTNPAAQVTPLLRQVFGGH